MRHLQTDVLVVGGGPAGLSAAIAARQHGFEVMVADLARPPIDKACGEGLMPDSLAALARLGVTLDGLSTAVFRGIRFIGNGQTVSAEFPNGIGLGIRRTLLHSALIDRAEQAGVVMRWGTRVEIDADRHAVIDGSHVKSQWLIGADGNNSRVRKAAGLDYGIEFERRIGIRRHFKLQPWTDLVEIYWGEHCQAYVTPIGCGEICVAVISRVPVHSFESAIAELPLLERQLRGSPAHTTVKGAVTVSRRLRSITSGRVSLIGEASGSVDAITGEGLAMCFRQAEALGRALAGENLQLYERAHRSIMSLPHFMSRSMLLMDKSTLLRRRVLRALASKPQIFDRLLSIHVGALPLIDFGIDTALNFGWKVLTA
jgi:flavin-dependent dehydrogenase